MSSTTSGSATPRSRSCATLAITEIKIDRIFIAGLDDNEQDRAIVALGHRPRPQPGLHRDRGGRRDPGRRGLAASRRRATTRRATSGRGRALDRRSTTSHRDRRPASTYLSWARRMDRQTRLRRLASARRGTRAGAALALPPAAARPPSSSRPRAASAGRRSSTRPCTTCCPAAVTKRGTLQVGTDASYAPMSSFGPDGRTIIGMEPDLGAAIGRVLGVRVRFPNQDFTRLLPDVVDGPDRPGHVGDDRHRAARPDRGLRQLLQRRHRDRRAARQPRGHHRHQGPVRPPVAVEAGTTQVDLLARAQTNCPGEPITVRTYPTNSDALVQLRTGRAVAVLNDLPPAVFLRQRPADPVALPARLHDAVRAGSLRHRRRPGPARAARRRAGGLRAAAALGRLRRRAGALEGRRAAPSTG